MRLLHPPGLCSLFTVMLDNTMATMGDLIAFKGFENASVPFTTSEHEVLYKDPQRQYADFTFRNKYNTTCAYPRFWLETGFPVGSDVTNQLGGCYDSEFDQYGDFEGLGDFDGWKRQLSKAAGVQDRLRDWVPSVRQKIEKFSCLTIMMLDIDGYRIDKATQVTVDAMGEFSKAMRECAAAVGKNNFFITGEISGGNTFGSVFVGRGRQPDQRLDNQTQAITMTNASNSSLFIRDSGLSGVDASAFHYSIYRSLVRLLGMDGVIAGPYDTPVNLVQAWNELLMTNDMVNPSTGVFDPRQLFGTTNQDNFRWPAVAHGTEKMLLGQFLTTLHMPGAPLLLWGEEQAFYLLDNTADNYIYGRQAMSSAQAWKLHGCYMVGSSQYANFMEGAPAAKGCHDDWNSLDHRDPANPVRNIIKSMYQMRKNYPVLSDGYLLQQLSNQTREVYLPSSNGTATETGIWSTMRGNFGPYQDLSATGQGNQSVWLVYQNDHQTVDYEFNCSSVDGAFISPFDTNTTVKNLFYPFDEITLVDGPVKLGFNNSGNLNGCINNITLAPWEYRAYVQLENFVAPTPMITKFLPGHDARLQSSNSIPIELHFSDLMDCPSVTSSITVESTTEGSSVATVDPTSIVCAKVATEDVSPWFGSLPTVWTFTANLIGVSDGVHMVTVKNASSAARVPVTTQGTDHFFLCIGKDDNPIVFPQSANYSQNLLQKTSDGKLFIGHTAAGADSFRYSTNWGTSYSSWQTYSGGNTTITQQAWTGTSAQKWDGDHVIVQYHSNKLGSSDHIQQGDLKASQTPRRFPHLFVQGEFNQFGTDVGVASEMTLGKDGLWSYELMTEWPMELQVNEWGLNPNGKADSSFLFGDADGDKVLDRLPPSALSPATLNFFGTPPSPFLSWKLQINDGTLGYDVLPAGNRWLQMIMYILLWTIPVITACLGVWLYMQSFYQVKLNKVGAVTTGKFLSLVLPKSLRPGNHKRLSSGGESGVNLLGRRRANSATPSEVSLELGAVGAVKERRTVLIATMEYDIEDWAIKVKIGGLGVMAQLMGKNLGHQNLIWVVPSVGDVEYPEDEVTDPMHITILGKPYQINVQYHVLKNITYVILDAPVFRAQSKAIPYPERMDDMDSAIFYSAWNQCIAQAIQRFSPDLYHINDYHGALAPVYLLPNTIPCALSLHNAEFQGLWAMRTPEESKEVCEVYNISMENAKKYVQFGDVFNLLHAGASYLRIHQKGFGAVGVSKKYGKRSWARYPIFWGLKEIGQVPNPDPSDLAAWDPDAEPEELEIDYEFEKNRGDLRKQAQEWAHLTVDPEAELLVFVGRWSMQKGIDLIADAMPALLEENPKVQLICVGPVIDLHGKFAALKLDVLMKKYPGRVFSKPVFTALPPFIFSGAEFALIPSRDEPFGLVAVEFGRKGALGIGARVGGLGQMPGWWFTVESTTTSHLLHQFKRAIKDAMSSKKETRIKMRARSAKQRFPVAQWVADLETLQGEAIKIHEKESTCSKCHNGSHRHSHNSSPYMMPADANSSWRNSTASRVHQRSSSYENRRPASVAPSTRPGRAVSGDFTGRNRSSSQLELRQGERYSRARSPLGRDAPATGDLRNTRDSTASLVSITPYLMPMGGVGGRDRDYRRRSGTAGSRVSSGATLEPFQTQQPRFSEFFREHYADEDEQPENLHHPDSPEFLADGLLLPPRNFYQINNVSTLSLEEVVGNKQDFSLQKVDPSFTDSTEEYFNEFKTKLGKLTAANSETDMCIEEYLVKSEKAWHTRFRAAKLGRSGDNTPMGSRPSTPRPKSYQAVATDEFHISASYKVPRGLRKYLSYRIGDWPLYTILLAIGQIMGANSYQITLLSGPLGQNAEKFYIISGIYLASSILFWLAYRMLKSVHILSIPFIIYGFSLLLLGISPFFPTTSPAVAGVQYAATVLYTIASASGSLYFALNFGDEGGSPVKAWVFRACVIQGTQQVYNCALWFWGSRLATSSSTNPVSLHIGTPILLALSVILFFIGIALYTGLPSYYRQTPGKLPSFYASLLRRKIVLWFLVTVLIQNFFLSTLTGRNWTYLWSSSHTKNWQIALLAVFFFVFLWALFLFAFGLLAKTHTWIIPIFAIGLGAPRWAQILWSCTPIGQFLPWAGTPLASALLGRGLWLWLGLLDALQGVGFGMILLQTLTRIHISATLIGAQILGSGVTMIARAIGPDNLGPATVFPDFSKGVMELGHPWFWVGLGLQIVVCAGFFKFFRKEQLSKP
jgi:alpha-1,3-glucan synthase